jgi:3-mercaptopyruvate sulfurtransferase SseA
MARWARCARWLAAALTGALVAMAPAQAQTVPPAAAAAAAPTGPLVSARWLKDNLARLDPVLIDASGAQAYGAGHIPGAINVDIYATATQRHSRAGMEKMLQAWGVSPGRKVVLYDPGGTYLATRVFFDLVHHGAPVADLMLLDGGMAQWRAAGGEVSKAPAAARAAGTLRLTQTVDEVRIRLPEFINASGDPARHALVEALDPEYYYGGAKFFDRAGHVPNAILWPSAELFNADKTFKSADEIRRMARHLGIRPEQQVAAYCGGGVAASGPFFALKYLAGYPNVKLYVESQLEWLRDERGLPVWSWAAPGLMRSPAWLAGWNSENMRAYGVSGLSVIDVRPAAAYALGHVPFALGVPAETLRRHLGRPEALQPLLSAAGVNAMHEAVVVGERGLDANTALALLALEQAGQRKVSLLSVSVDEWGLGGQPLVKEPTAVGAPKAPQDLLTIPVLPWRGAAREGVLLRDAAAQGASGAPGGYPRVFVASGPATRAPAGTVVQLPAADLLDAAGAPRPAHEVWTRLAKAGVPRFAEIVTFADDVGQAAINYVLLRKMGFADVKVWLPQ